METTQNKSDGNEPSEPVSCGFVSFKYRSYQRGTQRATATKTSTPAFYTDDTKRKCSAHNSNLQHLTHKIVWNLYGFFFFYK